MGKQYTTLKVKIPWQNKFLKNSALLKNKNLSKT